MVFDCKDKYPLTLAAVNDVEGKPRYSSFPLRSPRRSANVGKLCNSFTHFFDDSQEPKTKSFATLFIEACRFDHLCSRGTVDIN